MKNILNEIESIDDKNLGTLVIDLIQDIIEELDDLEDVVDSDLINGFSYNVNALIKYCKNDTPDYNALIKIQKILNEYEADSVL